MSVICFIGVLIFIFVCLINKNWSNAVTYITLGITLPLFLYLQNWSGLITTTKSKTFIYIFAVFYFLLFVYSVLTYNIRPSQLEASEQIVLTNAGRKIVPLVNFVFFSLYLLENYLGSGSIVPALMGIDIHTFNVSVISYITASPIIVISVDYFAYLATKKLRFLVLLVLAFLTPVLTRGSRMAMVSAAICFISLFLFFNKKSFRESLSKNTFRKVIFFVIVLAFAFFLIAYTNIRMNQYGKYNMKYDDLIQFCGPKFLRFIAPYYGYFPLSFNNLNINLLWQNVNHNYIGLYSFPCLFFGIFHLQFFGIDQAADTAHRVITSPTATVPTGFWEYYFDYGYLLFIPLLVAFFICWIFLVRSSQESETLNKRTMYFWFVSFWFLMSFQNVIFGPIVIISGLMLNYCIKWSFRVKKYNNIGDLGSNDWIYYS